MNPNEYRSCVPTAIRVEPMQVIRNLIEVKISDEQLAKADFNEGIQIQVRSERPFTVNAYWIVKINDIHLDISKDWQSMRDALWNNEFLVDNQKSLHQIRPQIFLQCNEQVTCTIKPPQPIDTAAITTVTPRDFYPLVVIVSCHDEEANPQGSDAAANIHIIHIKDEIVPVKSHVIKQYIKQVDGRILDISPLFVEETSACIICFEEADLEAGIKLLCLLPCRHSPICSNCIRRIRECPKCRSPIASVFDIHGPQLPSSHRPTIDPSVRHLYDDADEDCNTNNNSHRRRAQNGGSGFLGSLKSFLGI